MVVDLPDPFGPRKPNISPFLTENDMRFTATNSPNLFSRSLTETASLFELVMHQSFVNFLNPLDHGLFQIRVG